MRVVSLVSTNLFEKQSEKYQNILLPKDIKTFTLEFNSSYLDKYASNKECIFKINDFFVGGSKEEKLKYFALNMDALKAKIIEELKK